MKKILVVLTGGTIGSRVDSNVIDVSDASAFSLISLYNDRFDCDCEFEVIQAYNILSENIVPSYWELLCKVICDVDFSYYDGIIITHGSDTLSYTSSLIGMLFFDVPIPIILIASNYALGLPKSNGLNNFRSAVCFIKEHLLNGVFTIYSNADGENQVFLPTRIMEADTYEDQFRSFGGCVLGKIENNCFVTNKTYYNPSIDDINMSANNIIKQKDLVFNNNVLFIRPFPGLNYDNFNLDNVSAVVHYLYHSATACTTGDNYSLVNFINRCKENNIDFYIASFKSSNANMYASSKELLDSGAIPLINISPEASYIKALIAYNQHSVSPKEYMSSNIYFEILPEL